jgi:hypothetical protein
MSTYTRAGTATEKPLMVVKHGQIEITTYQEKWPRSFIRMPIRTWFCPAPLSTPNKVPSTKRCPSARKGGSPIQACQSIEALYFANISALCVGCCNAIFLVSSFLRAYGCLPAFCHGMHTVAYKYSVLETSRLHLVSVWWGQAAIFSPLLHSYRTLLCVRISPLDGCWQVTECFYKQTRPL